MFEEGIVVEVIQAGVQLIETKDLLFLAGVSPGKWRTIQRKYPGLFVGQKRIGYAVMWHPETVALLMEYSAKIRPYHRKRGRKVRK